MLNAILTEEEKLGDRTIDWAEWTDTYDFVIDKNDDYISANLGKDSQIDINNSFIFFIDPDKRITFASGYDLQAREELPVPEPLLNQIFSNPQLVSPETTDDHVEGLLITNNGPLLLAANPILTSEKDGPIHGSLIMARYLDQNLINEIGEKINQSFTLHTFDDPNVPPEVAGNLHRKTDEQLVYLATDNRRLLTGYAMVPDLNGEPALIAKIPMTREVYQQGEVSMIYLAVSTLAAGFIFGAAMIFFLNREILSRLSHLSSEVLSIGTNNLSKRVTITGEDELTNLSSSINSMLGIIEEAQNQLERFVYIVSHDLRSPLTAMRSYVAVIKEEIQEGDMDQVNNDFANMEKITKNMGEMIDGLLLLSRVKREARIKETVDLNQVVQKVYDNVSILLKEKNIIFDFTPNFPTLQLFRQPMQEVFNNLISNAIKFVEGQPNARIIVGHIEQPQEHQFFIRDNGIGIPSENMQKLFTLFFRDGKKAGSGIGLSVVKEYVQLHNGRVWVESVQGQGSTFWFSLPK